MKTFKSYVEAKRARQQHVQKQWNKSLTQPDALDVSISQEELGQAIEDALEKARKKRTAQHVAKRGRKTKLSGQINPEENL